MKTMSEEKDKIKLYEMSLKRMAHQAQNELVACPELCLCEKADYSVGLYSHQCLHHQLIDWLKVLNYQTETGEVIA